MTGVAARESENPISLAIPTKPTIPCYSTVPEFPLGDGIKVAHGPRCRLPTPSYVRIASARQCAYMHIAYRPFPAPYSRIVGR